MTKEKRESAASEARSLGRDAWERLKQNRMAWIGGLIFTAVSLLCLLGPLLIPHSYETTNLAYGAQPPSMQHWFGTDDLGRDLLVRTLASRSESALPLPPSLSSLAWPTV